MVTAKNIKYYQLFPLLDELEQERKGIKERVKRWLARTHDHKYRNNAICDINLFYYGLGDEYPINEPDVGRIFSKTSEEEEVRIDLNLIWFKCKPKDPEQFYVEVSW